MSLPHGIVVGRVYGSALSPDHRLVTRIQRTIGKDTTIYWTVLGRSPPQYGQGREQDFRKWATIDLTEKDPTGG